MAAETNRREAAERALAEHGSVRKAARALGIPPSTFQHWQKAPARAESPVLVGSLRPRQREAKPLPPKGEVARYILTCAQNNTALHEQCWQNLETFAAYRGAEIMIASFTYNTGGRSGAGQKSSREAGNAPEVWDERVVPFLADRSIELAPGLVWCGELQILPTATDPISGLESYTGRDSAIIPHVKFAITSVATPKGLDAKFVYTTGTVTVRNYIEKKAGQKASFHHGYGALLVEVCDDGEWFVRQLNADSEGTLYDLGTRVEHNVVTEDARPACIVWGDIHTRQLEPAMAQLAWGEGGIADTLFPRAQVMHDVLDFRSQNHHERDDPWKTYAKHVECETSVHAEVAELAEFLNYAQRPWCETVVVAANHDEAMTRWLKEADYREDPENAVFILEATAAAYRAMKERDACFMPIEWAVRREVAPGVPFEVRFLRRDERFVVCEDAQGGICLDMHGDIGPNGARGNVRQFAKTGQKAIIGHGHSLMLHNGTMQVGVMGSLDMGYNQGLSSWSQGFAIVYQNGKRTPVVIKRGRWRA